jgi:iron complex outermembrane receptor protein
VLSASNLPQPVNRAPAAVTVITREMIEASGFRHLVDVLRLVPGFLVGWSGGNMPAATLIGLSGAFPHWMQIMVDGRSVYNPAYGHTTWRGIPITLDEIDRIEVVRGPNAANDGLNSMLGTVHIYTRHSSMTLGGMGEVAAGDKQYQEANLRYGAQSSKGSWRLSLRALEDERHGVSQDHATDLQMSFRGDFQPTLQDDLMVEFGASRNYWEGTNVGQYFVEDQHTYYLSGFANLKWRRALGPGREWSLHLDHTFNQNEEDIADPLNGDYRTTGSSVVFNYLDQPAADIRTRLSGEYRLNRVKLPAMLGSDDYIEDDIFRVSGAAEWSLSPEWVLHASAMLEHHSDTGEAYLSPRLALNWLASSEHAFRVSASQGLSALGLYVNNTDIRVITNKGQLDQQVFSSGTVDPEKIDSIELGYLFSKPAWGLNLDVRAFHSRIDDIVGQRNIPSSVDTKDGKTKTYWNEREGTLLGLEYQLRWQAGPHSWLMLSQSWMSSDTDPDSDKFQKSVPPYTFSLLASHRIADIDVSLGYYRIGDMCWLAGEYDSKYNRLDLRLAKDWKTVDGRIQAALVFQSLLGEEFESFSEDPYERQDFERRGYLSLKYEFK